MSHSKTKYQSKWSSIPDANGHEIGLWCVESPRDAFEARCKLCETFINVANNGVAALKQHSKAGKHVTKAELAFTRKEDVNHDKTMKVPVQSGIRDFFPKSAQRQQRDTPAVVPTDLSVPPPPLLSATTSKSTDVLSVQDLGVQAEILWILKAASSNYSFSSVDGTADILKKMFPDSLIAQRFSVSHQKMSYLVAYGLGPYFRQLTIDDILSSKAYFTVHFDETVTNQGKKQLDVLLRYYSESSKTVQVHFITALMFGHAYAETVTKELLDSLRSFNLPFCMMLSISCDGPNVNKSISSKLEAEVKSAGSKLVSTGFCVLHVIHNSFKYGCNEFGQRAVNFTVDLFQWFHNYPAREEDYAHIQEELNLEELKFLRHVESRWLSLVPAVQRILNQFDAIVKYFKDFLPKTDTNSTKSDRFKRLYKIINENQEELKAEMYFLESVKEIFDTYLVALQKEEPLIHILYPTLAELLKALMSRFLKPDVYQGKTGTQLVDINVDATASQLKDRDLHIGEKTRKKINKFSERRKAEFLAGTRSFYKATTRYLQSKLPLKNPLLKSLVILHPDVRKSTTAISKLKIACRELPCCSDLEIDKAVDEWMLYQEIEIPNAWIVSEQTDLPLPVDQYWSNVLEVKNVSGSPKFPVLSKVVKCALALPHGNSDTERSLSQNKKVLTKERASMNTQTLIGLRLTTDGVKSRGQNDPCKVHISPLMITQCKNAHSMYEKDLKLQKEKATAARKKEQEALAAKRKAEEDERKRLDKVKTLKDKNKEIDDKIDKIEKQFEQYEQLSKESSERMERAIECSDMAAISMAHELQELSRKKLEETRQSLIKLNEEKKKVVERLGTYAYKKRKL